LIHFYKSFQIIILRTEIDTGGEYELRGSRWGE